MVKRIRHPAGCATAAAAVLVLAACGTVPASGDGVTARTDVARSPQSGAAPQASGAAAAAALAQRLLAGLHMPPGSRDRTAVPPGLEHDNAGQQAAAGDSSERHRFLWQPQSPAALAADWRHVPAGLAFEDSGTSGQAGSPVHTLYEVSYSLRAVPAGIASAQLALTAIPARGGGSLVRASAQVIWYPARSAAEYIDPGRYHVLVLTAHILNPKPHVVRKVVTSPSVIARLATRLDRAPAAPGLVIGCPDESGSLRLSFQVTAGRRPAVVVTTGWPPCGGMQVTAGGRPQPALDASGSVAAIAARLLKVAREP